MLIYTGITGAIVGLYRQVVPLYLAFASACANHTPTRCWRKW